MKKTVKEMFYGKNTSDLCFEKFGVKYVSNLSIEEFKEYITDVDVFKATNMFGEPLLQDLLYTHHGLENEMHTGNIEVLDAMKKNFLMIKEILALMEKSKEVCKLVNESINLSGQTPLSVAVEREEYAWVAKKLVELGADTYVDDDFYTSIYDKINGISKNHKRDLYNIKNIFIRHFFTDAELEKYYIYDVRFNKKRLERKNFEKIWRSKEMQRRMNKKPLTDLFELCFHS